MGDYGAWKDSQALALEAKLSEVQEKLSGVLEAGLTVTYKYDCWREADDPVNQAAYLVELNNALSDLRTWLPGWDYETGTMPWDRDDDEV